MIGCKYCAELHGHKEKATKIAPQYVGGDDDFHVEWVAVCDFHFEDWYESIAKDRRLPAFDVTPEMHKKHPEFILR